MLDRMWAGWRSAYVGGEGGAHPVPSGEGSIFERILRSGLPDEDTYVLWRGRWCAALLNAYPYTTGHVMVLPQRAVADLDALEPDESAELWAGVQLAVRALRVAYRPEGINVGANLGLAAGAGVPDHLHLHVLPRWSGDTNFMTALAEVRVLPESLDDTWRKLHAAWPDAADVSAPSPER
jgi:ATP adenylyltransferase